MKPLNLIGLLGLATVTLPGFAVSRANAQIYAADSFSYPAGQPINGLNGGIGFDSAYAVRFGNTDDSVAAGSLTYNGLINSGNSASLFTAFGESRRTLSAFNQPDGTTAYASFLVQPNNANGLSGIELGNSGNDNTTLFIGATNGTYRLETLFGNGRISADTGIAAVSGQTTLLVLRLDFLAGNDNLTLYVNPTPGGVEPAVANATKNDVDFFANVNLFGLIGDNTSRVDEFRLGATYADVTPIPEPSTYAMALGGIGLLLATRRFRGTARV